jgi:hypothetical protein
MTLSTDSILAIAEAEKIAVQERRKKQAEAVLELDRMSQAMIDEHGLLNHSQAALVLGVSVKRICELVHFGKLRRFDFLGRTYVSVREVKQRRKDDVKAGRPKRTLMQNVVAAVKVAVKTDAAQVRLGGFSGPYDKTKTRGKKGV